MRLLPLTLLSLASACTGAISNGDLDAADAAPEASPADGADARVAVDVPGADVPRVDVPRGDVPRADVPRADAVTDARADVPPADVPRTTGDLQVLPPLGMVSARQVPAVAPGVGVRAFPGAEGFGAAATGGRGGRVIYVTTTAAQGPGSLTEALEASGPRYILFKVSGRIDLSARIPRGDVTIAGQSSPGGVVLRGLFADESPFCDSTCGAGVTGVHNVIVRHIRSRPSTRGSNGNIEGDAVRLRHMRNVILDHVSAGDATDEAFEISYSSNITVQDSILGETLGDHADRGGMLINYSNPVGGYPLDAIAVIRTVWVRTRGRYPEIARDSVADVGLTLRAELANNLVWGQDRYIETGHFAGVFGDPAGPAYHQLNWVGNLGVVTPSFPYGMLWFENPSGRSTGYFRDNYLSRYPDRTDHQLNYCCDDFAVAPPPARPAWGRSTRHPFPAVTYLPAADVRSYVLAHAGAFPRDPMDRRLMGHIAAGVLPGAPWNVNPAGDVWRTDWTTPPAAPADGDNDGMPDAWERARGTDPTRDDHLGLTVGNATAGLAGYPNLEVYLHELAQQRLTEGPWGR
jgi:hypothetical protein